MRPTHPGNKKKQKKHIITFVRYWPLLVDLVLYPLDKVEKTWDGNLITMLNRKDNYNFIKSVIQDFWEHNEGSIEDHGKMWAYYPKKFTYKKTECQRMLKLEWNIKKQYMEHQDSNTCGKLNENKYKLNMNEGHWYLLGKLNLLCSMPGKKKMSKERKLANYCVIGSNR